MTLDEAIEHAEEMAKIHCVLKNKYNQKCAKEHRQLAEWLRELKERREQPEIIRCKDCKWWGREDTYKDGSSMIVCKKGRSVDSEGFCHHAERSVDEDYIAKRA